MKLELKHLSCYLPYELKLSQPVLNRGFRTRLMTSKNIIDTIERQNYIKPILRPLSDLFEVINHNGKEFKPLDFIKDQCEEDYFIDTEFESYILDRRGNLDYLIHAMNYLPYGLLNKFIEWHFDVFGLIPKGLAINKNTL